MVFSPADSPKTLGVKNALIKRVIFMMLVPVVLSFFSESLNILCKHRIFKRKNIS